MFILRPATALDFSAIRALIHTVGINPTGLDWRRFIVAVSTDGEVIGCGQIKPHRDGSDELASIAVVPAWRGQGVARAIIERLISSHPGRLYLTCRGGLRSFYEKFGFRPAALEGLPPYFRRLSGLARLAGAVGLMGDEWLIMVREEGDHGPIRG
jgi:amino-acid N-acetyltransferase